ncbi:MAG: zinc-dependent alcohol dehydrogenase, partial [Acidimicrobiales bacterium]
GMLQARAVLGHEVAGVVVGGDPDRAGPADGSRVAVLPARRCGACPACASGRDNLCALQLTTSVGMGGRDGGWAELMAVPAEACHLLPTGVDPAAGALVEPYAVALHAVARSRVAAGTAPAVAVLGAGSVGLMTVAALRRAGVEGIAVAEPRPRRAAAAARLGAQVVEAATRTSAALGRPPDLVFDATGAPTAPGTAVELAAPGGQVVLLGVTGPGEQVPLPGLLWLVKEVDVVPSIAYTTAEFRAAVAAVADGAVEAIAGLADTRPLVGAPAAIRELERAGGPVKVLLAPAP